MEKTLGELGNLLKPTVLRELQGRPPAALAATPLTGLQGLTAEQLGRLNQAGLKTMEDLASLKDPEQLKDLKIDLEILQGVICALFYPQYDRGPGCAWEQLFLAAPVNDYVNYPNHPFHTRFGPVFYRGRLDGSARVLVVGQDPATDEILAARIFVGQAGQLAQNFLTKLGLTRSYLMFNTFLYGVQSASLSQDMVTSPALLAYRNKLLDRARATNKLEAIITFGKYGALSVQNWPGKGNLPVFELTHPTAPNGVATSWNSKLAAAHAAIAPDSGAPVDISPYNTSAPPPATDIPRYDLPFGLPSWHGTGGHTCSARGAGNLFETQILWSTP